jgi:hypothetical protein
MPLEVYASMFPDGDRAHHLARIIEGGDFGKDLQSTVGTSLKAAVAVQALAGEPGINSEFPDFIRGLYQGASAAGLLDQDSASVIEVFRGNA